MQVEVRLIDRLGSDLTVANAARVSFARSSDALTANDKKLIAFLAREGHWSPFGHVQLQFWCKAPVFIARQLMKHQVGLVWNEVSRRYVDKTPEFFAPTTGWRLRAADKKQGSTDTTHAESEHITAAYDTLMALATDLYTHLVAVQNIAPEQARMVLPQSLMTEWYWTGSLYAFARVCKLRLSGDAQRECQVFAKELDNQIAGVVDLESAWAALRQDSVK
jgi:thymidylate synthase (FAD)